MISVQQPSLLVDYNTELWMVPKNDSSLSGWQGPLTGSNRTFIEMLQLIPNSEEGWGQTNWEARNRPGTDDWECLNLVSRQLVYLYSMTDF